MRSIDRQIDSTEVILKWRVVEHMLEVATEEFPDEWVPYWGSAPEAWQKATELGVLQRLPGCASFWAREILREFFEHLYRERRFAELTLKKQHMRLSRGETQELEMITRAAKTAQQRQQQKGTSR